MRPNLGRISYGKYIVVGVTFIRCKKWGSPTIRGQMESNLNGKGISSWSKKLWKSLFSQENGLFTCPFIDISGIEPLTSWMPWAPWCILNNIYVKISLISPICLHKNPLYISWCIMFRRNSGMHSGTQSFAHLGCFADFAKENPTRQNEPLKG